MNKDIKIPPAPTVYCPKDKERGRYKTINPPQNRLDFDYRAASRTSSGQPLFLSLPPDQFCPLG